MKRIRTEQESDYRIVEELTRKAFWNVNVPGCNEHYLAHHIRKHEDFIPELDFVIEEDHKIVGNVMYTKSKLINEDGTEKSILTFGPLSILPEYQRRGYGKALLEYSFEQAKNMGYDVIVIYGNPDNYVSRGFKSCKKYNICLDGDIFPSALLVKELVVGTLNESKWYYEESPAYNLDMKKFEEFDAGFEPMEKKELPCQEEFYIHCHSIMR